MQHFSAVAASFVAAGLTGVVAAQEVPKPRSQAVREAPAVASPPASATEGAAAGQRAVPAHIPEPKPESGGPAGGGAAPGGAAPETGAAPAEPPEPAARPVSAAPAPEAAAQPEQSSPDAAAPPEPVGGGPVLPQPRPADTPQDVAPNATTAPSDGTLQPGLDAEAAAKDTAEAAAAEAACRARLTALGVVFKAMPSIEGEGGCGVAAPVEVSEVAPGVALTPAATLNCRTAEALARWIVEVVAPAAKAHLNAPPNALTHASTYVCRPRNNEERAKLSEHASANAIDIAAIGLAGREPVAVVDRDGEDADERFLQAIRTGACAHFTTVLGPGSDAAHATHFHFDMAQRKRGYRMCQ
jgi:hypothetical protein